MAAEWKHKRYFRVRGRELLTFSSTSDANTKIGFTSAYSTSSPTKTEALEDSNKTLVVTYEFNSLSEQTAFNDATNTGDSTSPFSPADSDDIVEHFKTVWLHADGSVSKSDDL